MAKKKLVIIGGGMAGMVSAIIAAEAGAKVTLLERNDKIGKKLLVTGNGRCNISNQCVGPEKYHSRTENIFETIYRQFDLRKTRAFLTSIGIDLVELEDGKLYPQSLQAVSVVKALLYRAEEVGVEIHYHQRVLDIEYTNKFRIYGDEQTFYGDYLIVATGGKSYADSGSSGDGYEIAKRFGHHIIEPMPSIVQLVTDNPYSKSLKGLKINAKTQLINRDTQALLREESGEVLFTEYGLSGPTILQLSTLVAPLLKEKIGLTVAIDFFPEDSIDDIDARLMTRFHQFPSRLAEQVFNGYINQRLIIPLFKYAQVDHMKQAGNLTKEDRNRLVAALKNYHHKVEDTYLWNQAQVTKGGVSCLEIDSTSLESKLQENLYFIGEVLDIDGDCGGYNLQWAISSGALVSQHITNA
jgi:predicted Rossmann fold flavoprotein